MGSPPWGHAPGTACKQRSWALALPLEPRARSPVVLVCLQLLADLTKCLSPPVTDMTSNCLSHLLAVKNHLNAWHAEIWTPQAKVSPFQSDTRVMATATAAAVLRREFEGQVRGFPSIVSSDSYTRRGQALPRKSSCVTIACKGAETFLSSHLFP